MTLELLGFTWIKIVAIIIELTNIGLLTGLLYLYTKSYRRIKIGFTVGLISFTLLLLIKSILATIFIIVDTDVFIGRPVYIGGIIEIIALAILLKITWDY